MTTLEAGAAYSCKLLLRKVERPALSGTKTIVQTLVQLLHLAKLFVCFDAAADSTITLGRPYMHIDLNGTLR